MAWALPVCEEAGLLKPYSTKSRSARVKQNVCAGAAGGHINIRGATSGKIRGAIMGVRRAGGKQGTRLCAGSGRGTNLFKWKQKREKKEIIVDLSISDV